VIARPDECCPFGKAFMEVYLVQNHKPKPNEIIKEALYDLLLAGNYYS